MDNSPIRMSRLLFVLLALGLGLFQSNLVKAQTVVVQSGVTEFALSHRGDRVALAVDGTSPLVIDVTSGETLVELADDAVTTPVNSVWASSAVMWSGDDKRILTVHDSEIAVWSASNGDLLFELEPHLMMPIADDLAANMSGNFSAAISSDGSRIAVGNWFDAIVSVYEIPTADLAYQFLHQNDLGLLGVLGMKFSPTDDLLATWELTATVTLWNLDTGEKQLELPGETMAFSSSGNLIATGVGRFVSGVWIWNAYTGHLLMEAEAPLVAQELEWTNDNTLLFGRFSSVRLLSDGFIYVGEAIRGWNVATGQEEYRLGLAETFSIGLEPGTGETIIGVGAYHAERYVLLWNQITNDVYNRQFSPDDATHDYDLLTVPISSFAVQMNGSSVYAGLDDEIAVWNMQTGEITSRIPTSAQVMQIDYSESEDMLVALLNTGELLIIPEDELFESPTHP